jgi:acetyl-CoA carboxylase, biotin carboxylase subunit
VRLDTAIEAGSTVSPYYDSMIAKLIVHAPDRPRAVARLRDALQVFEVEGVATNIGLLRAVTGHPDFLANQLDTRWLETVFLPQYGQPEG